MTPGEMTRQVGIELEHIPEGPGEYQGELRMIYNTARRASLGRDADGHQSASEVMRFCFTEIRSRHPDSELQFDATFFGSGPGGIRAYESSPDPFSSRAGKAETARRVV